MNVQAKSGQKFSLDLNAKDEDGNPYSLSSFTLTSRFIGPQIDISLTVENGGIEVIDAQNGKYKLNINLTDMPETLLSGDVRYDSSDITDYSEIIRIKVSGVITV